MRLRIHYDFGSPYAYIAWQRVRLHPERYAAADIEWIPVSAAHILRMDGSAPNMTLPNQSRYLVEDLRRVAADVGVPFAPPAEGLAGAMPVRSIEALRMQFYADRVGRADAWREAVFLAYFQEGQDISDVRVLADLAKAVGLPKGAEVVGEQAYKQALIDATAQAYQDGAPGVPFMTLDDGQTVEHYWGQDRMAFIERRLGPLPGGLSRAARG